MKNYFAGLEHMISLDAGHEGEFVGIEIVPLVHTMQGATRAFECWYSATGFCHGICDQFLTRQREFGFARLIRINDGASSFKHVWFKEMRQAEGRNLEETETNTIATAFRMLDRFGDAPRIRLDCV